jgi:hypothetical protein
MPWFKVDDSLAFHAKVVAAGNAPLGLWIRAGAWCAQQLTDGHVPAHMIRAFGTSGQAAALVKAGLWERTDDGYCFHDWLDYQPTAAEVQAERTSKHEAKVRAGRAGGVASGIARRKHDGSSDEAEQEANGKQNEAPTRPDPTRPRGSTNLDPPDGFAAFWMAYPRKVDKGAALKAYKRALKVTTPDVLVAAARRYAASRQGQDQTFTKHPSTWLNAESWADEEPRRLVPGRDYPSHLPPPVREVAVRLD